MPRRPKLDLPACLLDPSYEQKETHTAAIVMHTRNIPPIYFTWSGTPLSLLEYWPYITCSSPFTRYVQNGQLTSFQLLGDFPIRETSNRITVASYTQGPAPYVNNQKLPHPINQKLCFGPILFLGTDFTKCHMAPLGSSFLSVLEDEAEENLDDDIDIEHSPTEPQEDDDDDGSYMDDDDVLKNDYSYDIIDDRDLRSNDDDDDDDDADA